MKQRTYNRSTCASLFLIVNNLKLSARYSISSVICYEHSLKRTLLEQESIYINSLFSVLHIFRLKLPNIPAIKSYCNRMNVASILQKPDKFWRYMSATAVLEHVRVLTNLEVTLLRLRLTDTYADFNEVKVFIRKLTEVDT